MFGYIGSFPPPFGGVTVKNEIWFNELKRTVNIIKIKCSKNFTSVILFLFKFLYCRGFVIGIGGKNTRIIFTKLLAKYFPGKMKNSIIFIMGGSFANCIQENRSLVKYFNCYKTVFVELDSMRKELVRLGFNNVYYIPNCRERPYGTYAIRESEGRLRCLVFSMIFPEKGVDIVLEASKIMSNVDFFFWGEIRKEYQNTFLNHIEQCENCSYCGVYKHKDQEVYALYSQYDVLLFPTRWKSEGMPGTLIESKIAGVPAIVSAHAYNEELVEHLYDGIVMESNDVKGLVKAIECLDQDRTLLKKMKQNAQNSSQHFFIDRYVQDVINRIEGNDYKRT